MRMIHLKLVSISYFLRVWLYKASDGPEFDEQRYEISKDVLLHVNNSQ